MDWTTLGPLLWKAAGETLYMVLITLAAGGFYGLAIGLGLYLTRSGNLLAKSTSVWVIYIKTSLQLCRIPFLQFPF